MTEKEKGRTEKVPFPSMDEKMRAAAEDTLRRHRKALDMLAKL